jgi:PAS domain S-box-containing protein/putative nucleotidyltransferase with HDIG domain
MKTKAREKDLIFDLMTDRYNYAAGLNLTEEINSAATQELHYQAVFDSIDSTILIMDRAGTIVDANNMLEEISGYGREAVIGKRITVLSRLINSDNISVPLGKLDKKAPGVKFAPAEVDIIRNNGEQSVLEISSRPFKHEGRIIGDLVVLKDITESKRIQQLMAESEYKFRMLAEESPNLMFIHQKNSLIYVNRKLSEVLGYRHQELCSPGFDFLSLMNMECRIQVAHIFRSYEKNKASKSIECTLKTRSGKQIKALLMTKVINYGRESAVLGVITDVTQLKAAESLSRAVLNSPAIGIYIAQNGKFKLVNPAFRNLADRTEQELINMDPMEIVYAEDQNIVRENAIKMLKGELTGPYEFRYVRKNGEVRWVAERVVSIIYGGERASLGTFIDITERRRIEGEIKESYKKLQRIMEGAIEAIASIAETRDPYTAGHQRRVAGLASAIAKEMGLGEEQVAKIRIAGLLHDIGKVAVPAELLSKPGKLNETEFDLIKLHPQLGRDILKTMELPWVICPIVLQHHERMDGSGYPRGLKGDEICLEARILAVADVVEAMASHRPYRPSLGIDKALEEISNNRGKLYDSEIVDICLKLFQEKGYKLG